MQIAVYIFIYLYISSFRLFSFRRFVDSWFTNVPNEQGKPCNRKLSKKTCWPSTRSTKLVKDVCQGKLARVDTALTCYEFSPIRPVKTLPKWWMTCSNGSDIVGLCSNNEKLKKCWDYWKMFHGFSRAHNIATNFQYCFLF